MHDPAKEKDGCQMQEIKQTYSQLIPASQNNAICRFL